MSVAARFPFCPALGIYAAIRMDPEAMVAHLDAQAIAEAQAIHPKTYLVKLDYTLAFPFPGYSSYGYSTRLVGPSPRGIDDVHGFDLDMCIPIFPNEAHPSGRAPIRTKPAFPFGNCYHWGLEMDIRVQAREGGFDETHAVALPSSEFIDMQSVLSQDWIRAKRARLARQLASGSVTESGSPGCAPANPSGADVVDIFAEPEGDDPEYVPLVHLWADLVANVKQEDIGNPLDLYKERYAIASIIRNAHIRDPDLPTLREIIASQRPPYEHSDSESDMSSDMDDESVWEEGERAPEDEERAPEEEERAPEERERAPEEAEGPREEGERSVEEGERADDAERPRAEAHVSKSKRFRPSELLRKLRSRVRHMLAISQVRA